jgi:hypothetical protein
VDTGLPVLAEWWRGVSAVLGLQWN